MVPFGGILVIVGLVMAGWIVAGVGLVMLVAGLFTANSARKTEHKVVEDRQIHTD